MRPSSPRLKDFLLQLAANLAAGLIPAGFLLLINPGIDRRELQRTAAIGVVFANTIGIACRFLIPRLYPGAALRGTVREWTIVTGALIGLATVGWLAGSLALGALGILPWQRFWSAAPKNLILCIFITLAFGLVSIAFGRLQGRLRQQELERERALKLAADARLASLESRIHPHFLFNTLNSISALIPVDPERAERLMERMAALLRFSLDAHANGLVPLDQEMKIVRDYLEIEQARLGPRLRYQLDPATAPEGGSGPRLPPLAVQTLVENSIKFAIAPNRQGGEIRVKTRQDDGRLRVEVSDTGPGFALDAALPGHGLDNLRSRLTALFGGQGDLSVTRDAGWTTVTLVTPL